MGFKDFVGDVLKEKGGLNGLKPGGKNPILGVGVHDLEVNRCVVGKSHPKKGGAFFFVAELTVLTSDNKEHPVGTTVSYFIGFKDYPELGMQRLLEFAMRGFGMTEAQAKVAIDKEVIWNEKQILAGEKLKCVAREQISPQSKKKFTAYSWSPLQTA